MVATRANTHASQASDQTLLSSLTRILSPSDTVTTLPFNEAWFLNIDFGMSGTVLQAGRHAGCKRVFTINAIDRTTQNRHQSNGGTKNCVNHFF